MTTAMTAHRIRRATRDANSQRFGGFEEGSVRTTVSFRQISRALEPYALAG
jgi:hypothetical protein